MSAVHKDMIPASMRAHRQWVLWKYELRPNGKRTKPPYCLDGKKAKSNNPSTWCSFDEAVSASGFDGIGFAFSQNDGLVGIDLDHCIDPETGEMMPWAQEIIEIFSPTYIERSPSGDGIHIICRGKALATGAHKWKDDTGKEVGLEVYDYTSPRYFTVTGEVLFANDVVDCQSQLEQLWERYFCDEEEPQTAGQHSPGLKLAAPNRLFVENALRSIPADEYQTWLRVGMALKAGGFEMELWDKWSATSNKYEPGVCAEKWETFSPTKISIGTVFYLANQYAPVRQAPPAPPAAIEQQQQQTIEHAPVSNVVPINSEGTFIEHPRWQQGTVPHQYRLTESGVLKCSDEKKSGELFCGPIYVLAETTGPSGVGSAGLVLEMQTRDGSFITMSVPRSRLYEDARILAQEIGYLNVDLISGKEKELLKYLSCCHAYERRISVEQTGWVPTADPDKLVYVSPTASTESGYQFQPERYSPTTQSYRRQGTISEWVDNVWVPSCENPYASFVVFAALSAVILKWAQQDSGGFHLYGGSSSGKTTLAQIAASLFGCGADPSDAGDSYIRRWNTTVNALEGVAAAHNDSPLIIDEIGSYGGKDFGKALYDVSGGQGKSAMDASRNLKRQRTWRNLIISTGEVSCKSKIEEGMPGRKGNAKAGQLLRLIDIEIRPSIFGSRDQVDRIKRACSQYYGTFGQAFIESLVQDYTGTKLRNTVQDALDRCVQRLMDLNQGKLNSVQERALKRFALAEVAGLLVARTGLIKGLSIDSVRHSVDQVVIEWLPNSRELHDGDRALTALREFILSNRDARFKRFKEAGESTEKLNREIAGYYDKDRDVFFMLPAAVREATGCDPSVVAKTLKKRDLLLSEKIDRFTYRITLDDKRVPMYGIKASLLSDE